MESDVRDAHKLAERRKEEVFPCQGPGTSEGGELGVSTEGIREFPDSQEARGLPWWLS